jgi:hypothetical protein
MVLAARAVGMEAAEKYENGAYGPEQWNRSMRQLFDGAILGGVELAETMMAGPGARWAPTEVESDLFCVGGDLDCDRRLELISPLTCMGTMLEIRNSHVSFRPGAGCDSERNPFGRLSEGEKWFRIVVDTTGVASAAYTSKVRVSPLRPTGSSGSIPDVDIYIVV